MVLVVGAGPVGLTMAIELTRYGVPVRIVDKAASRTDKSKALVVWSCTLELLERAGCATDIVAAGTCGPISRRRRYWTAATNCRRSIGWPDDDRAGGTGRMSLLMPWDRVNSVRATLSASGRIRRFDLCWPIKINDGDRRIAASQQPAFLQFAERIAGRRSADGCHCGQFCLR